MGETKQTTLSEGGLVAVSDKDRVGSGVSVITVSRGTLSAQLSVCELLSFWLHNRTDYIKATAYTVNAKINAAERSQVSANLCGVY